MIKILSILTQVLVLVGYCYAREYRVVALPPEYNGTKVAVVIDDGTPIELSPRDNGYFWTGSGNDPSVHYYYIILDDKNNIVASENTGSQIDGSSNEAFIVNRTPTSEVLNEVFGRSYTRAGDLLVPIPRIYDPLEGYKDFSELFQEGEIQNIRAFCPDTTAVSNLLNDPGENKEIDIMGCELTIINPGEERTFTNVTLELSGQGSRGYPKRPFKVKLDENSTEKGNKKIHGRDKFKLRNIVFDCTGIKNKIAVDISTSLGLPAGQAAHARFYLNDYPFGLYDLTDVFKKKFLKSNFHYGEDKPSLGVLYKAVTYQGVKRNYLEQDPSIYSEIYDLAYLPDEKIGSEYNEITELIDWIHNTLPNASDDEVEKFINVELLLKDIVLEYLIDHRDGFFIAGNNYFIYKANGKFNVWSYDFDATFDKFAVYPVDTTWEDYQNIPSQYSETLTRNPLVEGIISRDKFKSRFLEILKDTVTQVFNTVSLTPRVKYFEEFLKTDLYWDVLVQPPATQYTVITDDIDYTFDQIMQSYTDIESYTCSGDTTGIYAYIRKRAQIVIDQYSLKPTCDFSKGSVGSTFESSSHILIPSAITLLIAILLTLYIRRN